MAKDVNQSSKALPIAGYLAVTTTPAALPFSLESFRAVREIVVQADPNNTDNVRLGNKSAQGITLQPGEDFTTPIEDPGEVWLVSLSGTQHVGVLGRD